MKQFSGFAILVLVMGLWLPSPAQSNAELEAIIKEHQQALEISVSSPERGRKLHAQIASKLEAFYWHPDINQPELAYNIGSSWYLAGHYGYSLLWLRRAEQTDVHDARLQQNITYVRSQRLDYLPELFGSPWLNWLFVAVGSIAWKIMCGLVYFLFWWQLWRFISSGFTHRNRFLSVSALMLLVLASQVFRIVYTPADSDGVITAQEVVARKGPGIIYNPAFNTALNQGAEFVLLQQENGWSEVMLSNGEKAWVSDNAIAFVFEKRLM